MRSEVDIREPVTLGDITALHMLMLMHGQESAEAPVDAEKVMSKIVSAARQPDSAFMLMAVDDDKAVGYLCVEKVEYWYSNAHFLTDFGFYVLPAYRGKGVAEELKAAAEAIAKETGLRLKLYKQARTYKTKETADVLG